MIRVKSWLLFTTKSVRYVLPAFYLLIVTACILATYVQVRATLGAQSVNENDRLILGPSCKSFADSNSGRLLGSKYSDSEDDSSLVRCVDAFVSNYAGLKIRLRYKDSMLAIHAIENDLGRRMQQGDHIAFTHAERFIFNIPSVTKMYRDVSAVPYENLVGTLNDRDPIYVIIPKKKFEDFQTNQPAHEIDTTSEYVRVMKIIHSG